jgi:hypothetical protein
MLTTPMRLRIVLSLAGLTAILHADGWPALKLSCARAAEPAQSQLRMDRLSAPLVRTDLRIDSAASCAATSCHGGPLAGVASPTAVQGSEYPLWLERDHHARSWRTICSDTSVAILERLNIMRSGQVLDPAGFDNCLACHNTTRQFAESRSREHLREGIGCNACHGPSQRWRVSHYQVGWSSALAADDGFVPAGDMLARARMCASCHVGDRDRDMNHDTIAAGHPALHYEFATFHQRQLKHWRDPGASALAAYEARQWLAGQLAALDASLALLESRAAQSLPVSRWPEFAAYNCAACHQPLHIGEVDPPSASRLSERSATPGTSVVEFSHWNRFGVEELLELRIGEQRGTASDLRLAAALKRLVATMEAPNAEPGAAALTAQTARVALDQWLGSPETRAEIETFSAQRLQVLAISAGKREENRRNWETASQFYLASIAARHAWPQASPVSDAKSAAVAVPAAGSHVLSARRLRELLTFRPGTQSPASPSAWLVAPRQPMPPGSPSISLGNAWTDHLRTIEAVAPARAESILPIGE